MNFQTKGVVNTNLAKSGILEIDCKNLSNNYILYQELNDSFSVCHG